LEPPNKVLKTAYALVKSSDGRLLQEMDGRTLLAGRRKGWMSHNLIQSDPDVMTGKPVVRGTRITVETILRKLSRGESIEQILESHPRLTRESVLAALEYAAEAMAHETVHAVAEPDFVRAGSSPRR
jgi:uncharacterized protein (DUF433 family)